MATANRHPTTGVPSPDLADALQHVVYVTRNGESQPVSSSSSYRALHGLGDDERATSPSMPGAYKSSKDMKNPFEEASEASGQVADDRTKFKSSSSGKRDKSKKAKDKKPSRHADVIDTWDPTGLGSAMWHHSGPYDAAAPSRNVNQPSQKAPMQAFTARERAEMAARANEARSNPTITHAPPPPVPPKEGNEGRRPSAAARGMGPRRSSGGLSDPYSSSFPTGGGYFPNQDKEPEDEDLMSPGWRDRQRDEKQRALKAAWGIDEPEPFEDFGSSPQNEKYVDLGDHLGSPGLELSQSTSRSGGFLFNRGGPKSPPPIQEEGVAAPNPEATLAPRGSISRPGGGVKRSKSLMQRIKSMRGDRGDRSASPSKYSPGNEYPPMPSDQVVSAAPPPVIGFDEPRRPPPVPSRAPERERGRAERTGRSTSSSRSASASATRSQLPSGGARRASPVRTNGHDDTAEEIADAPIQHHANGNGSASLLRKPSLSQPPVMPVMPDFEEFSNRTTRRPSAGNMLTPDAEGAGAPVKRKTSVVKKLKDRVVAK